MKTYLITIIISCCIGMLSSCKKEEEGIVVDTLIELSFKDANGNDLLNQNSSNAYNHEDIDVIYVIGGKEERVYRENLDYPKGFFIYQQDSQNIMRLFPSDHDENLKTTTYIKLSETETDKVVCEVRKWGNGNQSVAISKIWYNDELVWDGTGPKYIEIQK